MVPNDFWGNGIEMLPGVAEGVFLFSSDHLDPDECLVQNVSGSERTCNH